MKLFALGAAVWFALLSGVSAAVTYKVTDLGFLPGGRSSGAFAINNLGHVTGTSDTAGKEVVDHRTFLYDGTMHDLGTLGGQLSNGFAITDTGLIAGSSYTSTGEVHAFLYDGAMHDLGTLDGPYHFSIGNSVNKSGHVAGFSFINETKEHAFLFDGTMHDLGTLGGTRSSAQGINDRGHVVGWAKVLENDFTHAFFYDGVMHDLGTLSGNSSRAMAINAVDQVTGLFTTNDGTERAFFYDGVMHDLGLLNGRHTAGLSINVHGHIVGESYAGDGGSPRAFVYKAGVGMLDLTTQLDPVAGWNLRSARGINDVGQIVGFGTIGSIALDSAYLLSPLILGDINRDLTLDAQDIPAMIAALSNLGAYKAAHDTLTTAELLAIADLNQDGGVTNADAQSLLDLLKSGGGSLATVPEPATVQLMLAALVIGCIGSAMRSRRRILERHK